jgi:hypothetical protein
MKAVCWMLYSLQICIIILVKSRNCGWKNTYSWRTIVLSSLTFSFVKLPTHPQLVLLLCCYSTIVFVVLGSDVTRPELGLVGI